MAFCKGSGWQCVYFEVTMRCPTSARSPALALLLLACASGGGALRVVTLCSRRGALCSVAAALSVAAPALADLPQPGMILDLDDELSPPPAAAVAVQAVQAVPAGEKKKSSKYDRMRELQSKFNLTDKEKKELRRLKADEMCEMLGKGC